MGAENDKEDSSESSQTVENPYGTESQLHITVKQIVSTPFFVIANSI